MYQWEKTDEGAFVCCTEDGIEVRAVPVNDGATFRIKAFYKGDDYLEFDPNLGRGTDYLLSLIRERKQCEGWA